MNLIFLKEFLKKWKEIGSVIPSSRHLASAMTENIKFESANVIVELGAGTGVFSDLIIDNKKDETYFLIFENNKDLYLMLKEKYRDVDCKKNVFIFNSCASNINYYLTKLQITEVDYIVSGLPFLSLSTSLRSKILENILKVKPKSFVIFQYTEKLKILLENYFKLDKRKRVLVNFPPAYVFSYSCYR